MIRKIYSILCSIIQELQKMNTDIRGRLITKGQAKSKEEENDE